MIQSLRWNLCFLILCWAATATAAETTETWEIIQLHGNRVGYAHSTLQDVETNGRQLVHVDSTVRMEIKRAGQRLVTTIHSLSLESPDGYPISFETTLSNPPSSQLRMSGEVQNNQLMVKTEVAGQTVSRTIPDADKLKSPGFIEHYLRHHALPEGESLKFQSFDPQMGKVVTMGLKRLPAEETEVWGGGSRRLGKAELTNSGLPGVSTWIYFDPENKEVFKTTIPLLGMTTYTVSEEEALREIQPYDQLKASMIPLAESQPFNAAEVTYKLSVTSSLESNWFPEEVGQHVQREGANSVLLTVRRAGPQIATELDKAAIPDHKYLAASRFIECEAPLIQQLALKGVGTSDDPRAIALSLEKLVRQHITKRNLATAMATALEVAQSQSGDCTEHAVLLAALLRARKIPSRVTIGMVYSSQDRAFVGHMWTEAWIDGHWFPLDATRAEGGSGTGHIKLTDSALDGDGAFPGAEMLPLAALYGQTTIKLVK